MKGRAHIVALLLTVPILPGCAIQQRPFIKFSGDVGKVAAPVKEASEAIYAIAKDDYVNTVNTSLDLDTEEIRIHIPEDGPRNLGWSANQGQEYLAVRKTQYLTEEGIEALGRYAALVAELAGDPLLDKKQFEDMAKELNSDASSIYKTLKKKEPPPSIGLVSEGAAVLFRSYLDHKRRSALKEAVAENDPNIGSFCELLSFSIALQRSTLTGCFNKASRDYSAAFLRARTIEKNGPADRDKIINEGGPADEVEKKLKQHDAKVAEAVTAKKAASAKIIANNELLVEASRKLDKAERSISEVRKSHSALAASLK